MENNIRYRILCHDRFDPNGQQWTEYWAVPYNAAEEDPYNYWGGASVVLTDLQSLEEAEELAEKFQEERAAMMEQHYKE